MFDSLLLLHCLAQLESRSVCPLLSLTAARNPQHHGCKISTMCACLCVITAWSSQDLGYVTHTWTVKTSEHVCRAFGAVLARAGHAGSFSDSLRLGPYGTTETDKNEEFVSLRAYLESSNGPTDTARPMHRRSERRLECTSHIHCYANVQSEAAIPLATGGR